MTAANTPRYAYGVTLGHLRLEQNDLQAIGPERLKAARDNAGERASIASAKATGAFVLGSVSGAVTAALGYAMHEKLMDDTHFGASWIAMTTLGTVALLSVHNFFMRRAEMKQAKADELTLDKAIVSLSRDPNDAKRSETLPALRTMGVIKGNTLRIA